MAFARTIVEENEVAARIDEAEKKYPRIEEVWEAWKWRLARDPLRDAQPIGNENYLIKATDLKLYGLPEGMTILYRFTDVEVVIMGVRIS